MLVAAASDSISMNFTATAAAAAAASSDCLNKPGAEIHVGASLKESAAASHFPSSLEARA